MSGTHIEQQIRRQHMHDGIGHAQTAQQNAEEVEERRHRHRKLGTHRPGVDNRRDGVCSIMKTVDCFVKQYESQCKQ